MLESISSVVGALTTGSTDLWSTFATTGGFSDEIKFAAERMERRLDAELELQQSLISKQVEYMDAKLRALTGGSALIQVNADNLAPELQMVMRSFLEAIQIEANAEGLELLI
jgi:hypothetical protein